MTKRSPAGAADEIQRMQDGVRDWVEQAARRGKDGLWSGSPTVLLSLLCASAFCPLLMATGAAGAGLSVLSGVGGGFLTQVISDALARLRQHSGGNPPSREDLQERVAWQIQQALAVSDKNANVLLGEIASVLKEIDVGGTALRAAMEQDNERVRSDVIAAIGVLGSDFARLGFLIGDVARRPRRSRKAWISRARISGRSLSRTTGSQPTSAWSGRTWRSLPASRSQGALGARTVTGACAGRAGARTGDCCPSSEADAERVLRAGAADRRAGCRSWPPRWPAAGCSW